MVIKNARLRSIVRIRPTESARMRQLQTDKKPVLGARRPAMLFNENTPQSRQALARMRCNYKLIRVGAPFMANRNGFPAPNELRAALSETPPPAHRKLA